MVKKFTFKREPRITGLAGVGYPHRDVQIKLNKKVVGQICAPSWRTKDNLYCVRFTVKNETREEPWRWVALKRRFENEEDVRAWLNENVEKLQKQITFYSVDDE